MIRNAMFYLNQNKPSVYDTVRVCAELCRERGIEPIFFENDRAELTEKLGGETQNARYLPEPDARTVDMLFVFRFWASILADWVSCWKRRRRSCRRRWICLCAANTALSGG